MAKTKHIGRIAENVPLQVPLDEKDRKIIYHLSEDSRITVSQLAKLCHLNRDTTAYRLERLTKKRVILKFLPIIDLEQFGFSTYQVLFKTSEGTPKAELIDKLSNHPNTKSLMEYSDRWDLEWTIIARSLQEFDKLVAQITTEFASSIYQKQKISIIKGFKSLHLPSRYYEQTIKIKQKKKLDYMPDATDLHIIKQLSKDTRTTNYEIAETVKVAPNTVRNRIQTLKAAQIIRSFSIATNLQTLGYHWYAMFITVKTFNQEQENKFKHFVNTHRFIIRAVKVLGPWDLMLYIVADTILNFHKTIKEIIETFRDIIISYDSLMAYQEHVYEDLPKCVKLE